MTSDIIIYCTPCLKKPSYELCTQDIPDRLNMAASPIIWNM